MNHRHLAAAVCMSAAFGLATTGVASAAPGDSDKVTLSGSMPTAATQKQLQWVEPARATQPLNLILTVPQRNQALAEQMLASGKVISPAEYTRLFGADQAQLNKVAAWARSQGFKVASVDRTAGSVTVDGTVGNANKSMGVKMSVVRKNGRSGVAPTAAPQLPKALGVTGVSGLDTTFAFQSDPPKHLATKALPSAPASATSGATRTALVPKSAATNFDGSGSCVDYWGQHSYTTQAGSKFGANQSNGPCAYSPKQIVSMYGAQGVSNAAPTLGILLWGNDTSAVANANKLAAKYGTPALPAAKYSSVVAPWRNGTSCDADPTEQNLDVQATHAIAPNASIRYYGSASCQFNDMATMLQKAVSEHKVSTLSMSFGNHDDRQVESASRTVFERALTQAGLTGISVFASTGDWGTNSEYTTGGAWTTAYPASSPRLTAVGGTAVGLTSTGTRAFTAGWENTIWAQPNRTNLSGIQNITGKYKISGAGGGNSKVFAKPSWQVGITPGTTRAIPDVSGLADSTTGMEIYSGGKFGQVGGTSLASPLIAALTGASKAVNNRQVGNAAPYFYKLRNTGAILDVNAPNKYGAFVGGDSSGNIITIGFDGNPQNALVTKAGWDNVTGVGEPTGATFISNFGR